MQSISRTYAGQQLQTQTQAGVTTRYLYDALGNLDCTVKAAYVGATCPAAGDTNLLEDNVYDYKSRLAAYRSYNGSATASKTTEYTNDPLDRPVKQVDWVSPSTTTTYDFTYVGVTNALSKEVLTGATATTKRYAYDVFGQRATITEGANRYSYLYDPHTSVSLLIDQANAVKESYGYTAYGAANAALTKSASGFDNQSVPKNPYRYTGKRLDSGSGTYDMGARRYSAGTGRFLRYDVFYDVLQNLGLSADPRSPRTGTRLPAATRSASSRSMATPRRLFSLEMVGTASGNVERACGSAEGTRRAAMTRRPGAASTGRRPRLRAHACPDPWRWASCWGCRPRGGVDRSQGSGRSSEGGQGGKDSRSTVLAKRYRDPA